MPNTDNSVDLGSSSLRWVEIYTADLQMSNEGSVNDVDGTSGKTPSKKVKMIYS